MTLRINRVLSEAGIASRRKADELIMAGRVMLNGKILREMGVKVDWGKDSIKVDGREIPEPSEKIYLILHKPFGYVCTLSDPQGRPIVTDLLRDVPQRVYPVGRLDFDSMGLLLLTNDGDFSFKLTHPKFHLPRTYKVTVQGILTEKDINTIKSGIQLEDGFIRVSSAAMIGRQGDKSLIRLTITQGKNRIVRRMIEAIGFSVVHLVRIGFGNLELGDLKVGKYRHLEPIEIKELLEKTSQDGRRKKPEVEMKEEKVQRSPQRPKGPGSNQDKGSRGQRADGPKSNKDKGPRGQRADGPKSNKDKGSRGQRADGPKRQGIKEPRSQGSKPQRRFQK